MTLINKMLRIAGKDHFEIDKRVGSGYIFRLCWKYGWMMLRGKMVSLGYANIAKDIFIGRNVRLYEKKHLSVGAKVKLHENVKIDALSVNGVKIGNCVTIGRNTVIECTGGLQHIGKGICIADNTSFGNDCFFGAAGGIEIGEDVVAGQYIRFHSENHNYNDLKELIKMQGVTHKGIKIGNNCWIGSGAVFLDGASIGNGCVVAANAVINKKFGDNVIIGGVPAKVIGYRGEKLDG